MKELIKKAIVEFQESLPLAIIPREAELPIGSGKIISVCGVRRCGKTYVLYDTINRLLKTKVAKHRILFFSFDDERFRFNGQNLDLILQAYHELYPDIKLQEVFFFFDEIQMAEQWEQFIRRIYDRETKNIFISGSNSKLLATEIATSLRGRTIQYEIFPLRFSEYCTFKKLKTETYQSMELAKLTNGFNEFYRNGGFPELVLSNYAHAQETLQEYYHIMLYKDIIERYQVSNIPVLKYLVSRLLANLTKPTSISKIFNEIKSAGLKIDKNVLYTLVDHLEAVYFTQRLGKFGKSVLKTELANERKLYFIDNGMINALNFLHQDDRGKLLENAVFLWIRSQIPFQRGMYFFKEIKECDFILLDREKPVHCIQVCHDVSSPDTLKREVTGLVAALKTLGLKAGTILTYDQENELEADGYRIFIKPTYKVMLKKISGELII